MVHFSDDLDAISAIERSKAEIKNGREPEEVFQALDSYTFITNQSSSSAGLSTERTGLKHVAKETRDMQNEGESIYDREIALRRLEELSPKQESTGRPDATLDSPTKVKVPVPGLSLPNASALGLGKTHGLTTREQHGLLAKEIHEALGGFSWNRTKAAMKKDSLLLNV